MIPTINPHLKTTVVPFEDVEFATEPSRYWSGTEIAVTKGGTGLTAVAADKIIYTSVVQTLLRSIFLHLVEV